MSTVGGSQLFRDFVAYYICPCELTFLDLTKQAWTTEQHIGLILATRKKMLFVGKQVFRSV